MQVFTQRSSCDMKFCFMFLQKFAQAVVEWRKSQVLEEKMSEDMKAIAQSRDTHQKLYAEQRAARYTKYSKIKWFKLSNGTEAVDDRPTLPIVLKGINEKVSFMK